MRMSHVETCAFGIWNLGLDVACIDREYDIGDDCDDYEYGE